MLNTKFIYKKEFNEIKKIKYFHLSPLLFIILFLTIAFIMKTRELCIECNRNKLSEDHTYFCQKCKNKIINYCWNYHRKLQDK
jgi:hypothetical protein